MTAVPLRHPRSAATRGRRARWLIWLAALLFLFQLAGAFHDHHDEAVKARHCAACTLHAQPHAAPPDAVLAVTPSGRTLLYVLAGAPAMHVAPPSPAHLRPPSQAPPAFLPTI